MNLVGGGEGASCMDEETGRRYSCNEQQHSSLVTSTGVHVYVCTNCTTYIHVYLALPVEARSYL
jgi:ribosomal protein L28